MNILFVLIVVAIAFILALAVYLVMSSHPAAQTNVTTTATTTTTTTKITTPQPNPSWASVLGYTDSFNKCRDLCKQYQQNKCSSQSASKYCHTNVSVDLTRDGKIDSNQIVATPAGTKNCETNAKCYDIINSCGCGNSALSIGTCVSLFYQNYIKSGMSEEDAISSVAQDTTGNCVREQSLS
jgi:hypothetical protein